MNAISSSLFLTSSQMSTAYAASGISDITGSSKNPAQDSQNAARNIQGHSSVEEVQQAATKGKGIVEIENTQNAVGDVKSIQVSTQDFMKLKARVQKDQNLIRSLVGRPLAM